MPIRDESTTATLTPTTGVIVSTSAAVELSWHVMSISELSKHTSSDEEQVASLRAEYPELSADRDVLAGDRLVGRAAGDRRPQRHAARSRPTALLDSSSAGVPEGPVDPRDRERAGPGRDRRPSRAPHGRRQLRKRYVAVLREPLGGRRNRFGDQADAEATAVTWRERLAAGAPAPIDLLSDKHVARRPEWTRAIRDAARNGTLVMTPVLCCRGGHIVAAGGVLSIAAPADAQDSLAVRRYYATEVAARLKVLSDPTRSRCCRSSPATRCR